MPDVFTKAKRSDVMSRIRSRGNKDTELALMRLLRVHKISGWRRHIKIQVTSDKRRVAGKAGSLIASHGTRHPARLFTARPDFVFPKARVAVFVDGCFWHCCPKHWIKPKGNAAFWRKKFATNRKRDALVTRTLRRAGWRVLRIWEHELKRGTRNAERGTKGKPTPGPSEEGSRERGVRNAERGVLKRISRLSEDRKTGTV